MKAAVSLGEMTVLVCIDGSQVWTDIIVCELIAQRAGEWHAEAFTMRQAAYRVQKHLSPHCVTLLHLVSPSSLWMYVCIVDYVFWTRWTLWFKLFWHFKSIKNTTVMHHLVRCHYIDRPLITMTSSVPASWCSPILIYFFLLFLDSTDWGNYLAPPCSSHFSSICAAVFFSWFTHTVLHIIVSAD